MLPFSCVERRIRWRARFRKFPPKVRQAARSLDEMIVNCTNTLKTINAIFRNACSIPNFLQFKVRTNVAKCAIFSICPMLALCNNNNIIDWLFPYTIIFIFAPTTSIIIETIHCLKPRLKAFFAVCRKHILIISIAIVQELIVYTLNEFKVHKVAQPFIKFLNYKFKRLCDPLPERLFKWDFVLICMTLILLRCGDIHSNPGQNNVDNSDAVTSTAVRAEKLKIWNWNARGLGKPSEPKMKDLIKLMKEDGISVAIISETRESVGHQAQRQLQVDGHTIYKSTYLDKSHTTKYLSPVKLVWGVCVIVKNGLAFSISNIVDLALGARLIHGTLTLSTSTETPMTIDILGIYGPATKDPQINEPYWKALQIDVEKLYEKNEVSFTQGSRQMVIGGDWNSY
jgi:hypothetical protein